MAKIIKAHITGVVWKVKVSPGDQVSEEDVVVIIESMKMETPIEAEVEGVVANILVTEGQAVTEGSPLVELE